MPSWFFLVKNLTIQINSLSFFFLNKKCFYIIFRWWQKNQQKLPNCDCIKFVNARINGKSLVPPNLTYTRKWNYTYQIPITVAYFLFLNLNASVNLLQVLQHKIPPHKIFSITIHEYFINIWIYQLKLVLENVFLLLSYIYRIYQHSDISIRKRV